MHPNIVIIGQRPRQELTQILPQGLSKSINYSSITAFIKEFKGTASVIIINSLTRGWRRQEHLNRIQAVAPDSTIVILDEPKSEILITEERWIDKIFALSQNKSIRKIQLGLVAGIWLLAAATIIVSGFVNN